MLYKEWRHTRLKFGLMLAFYAMTGVLVNTLFAPKLTDFSGHSVFEYWLVGAAFVTLCAGVLGGVDAIAEESDRGTIGFLLARPISGRQVYTVKIALNSLALTVALIVSSLAVFFTQFIPRYFTANVWNEEQGVTLQFPANVPFIQPQEAVSDVLPILALGLMLVCLAALVSVFARSTIQAICYTIVLIFLGSCVAYGVFYVATGFGRGFIDSAYMFRQFYEVSFPVFTALTLVAAGLFVVGLRIFKARDF